MATTTLLKKIQEYPELKTNNGIHDVIRYVNTRNAHMPLVYPPGLNDRQRNRFDSKFGNDDWATQHPNRLFYRPVVHPPQVPSYRLNLEIVYPARKQEKLREIYDDDRRGLGIGLDLFYYQVCSKYLGIKRNEVRSFLKRQGDYQLTRHNEKVINKPVLAKSPNERWEIDTIFFKKYGADLTDPRRHTPLPNNFNVLTANRHYAGAPRPPFEVSYRYCLTVVDSFSKKVWAEPLYDTTSNDTRSALIRIINRSHTIPRIIQTDNGAEYQGAFDDYIQTLILPNYTCQHIKTASHTPTSNGLVERMNQEIRKRIKQGIVRHNNLEWVNHIQEYCDNINNQRHTKNSYTPNELWKPGYAEPPNVNIRFNLKTDDHSNKNALRLGNQARIIRLANDQLRNGRRNVFRVGDSVRIVLKANHGEVRARHKNGLEKKLDAINFSPQIYRVQHVVPGLHGGLPGGLAALNYHAWDLKNESYWLINPQTGLALHRHYYGNELVKVPPNTVAPHVTTIQRARQLNRYYYYHH